MISALARSGRRPGGALVDLARGWNATAQRGYHENVIDHYENPRNVGSLDKNKKNVGTGAAESIEHNSSSLFCTSLHFIFKEATIPVLT